MFNKDKGSTMKRAISMLGAVVVLAAIVGPASAQTLKAVKDRGSLVCGVSQGLPGFSSPDDKGAWTVETPGAKAIWLKPPYPS